MEKHLVVLEIAQVLEHEGGGRVFPEPADISREFNKQIASIIGGDSSSSYCFYGVGNVLQICDNEEIGLTVDVIRRAVTLVCDNYRKTANVTGNVLSVIDVFIQTQVQPVAKREEPYCSPFRGLVPPDLANIKLD